MTVANGFGNKTEGAGAGSRIAVATNGVALQANIRRVRLSLRLAGIGRFLVVPGVLLLRLLRLRQRQRQHRLLRVNVGAALTARLSRQRPRNVANAKVNVIRRAKKRCDIARICAGVASTDTSSRSARPTAKNAVANVIHPEKKRSAIADNCVSDASTDRSCRFQ